jgi:hypothetical protein
MKDSVDVMLLKVRHQDIASVYIGQEDVKQVIVADTVLGNMG